MSSHRLQSLKRFQGAVTKKYGTAPITVGVKTLSIERLDTGSISLDLALGGGIPVGRVTMMYGQRSSGKTTTAYRIAGLAQRLCSNCLRPAFNEVVEEIDEETGEVVWEQKGECNCYNEGFYKPSIWPDERQADFKERIEGYKLNSYEPFRVALIDIEGSFDYEWAEKLGLDSRVLIYVRPDTAEETIDLYDSLMRTGSVDLFVLDSIASMTPSKEVEESVEKWQQGLQARLVNKFCRKIQSSANAMARDYGRAPTQIWINQLRMKIGVMFGNPETVPGGMAQEFATSVQVKLWSSNYEKEQSEVNKDWQVATSVQVNFKTEKNKVAPPHRTGSYVMNLDDGSIDDSKLFVRFSESLGQLVKESNTKWLFGGEEFKTKKEAVESILSERGRRYIKGLALKAMDAK